MPELKIISLHVDDIGVSKLHYLKLKSCPNLLSGLVRFCFDVLDSFRIKRIKQLAQAYGLPIAWAVVPYYYIPSTKKIIRFDRALPKTFQLIKHYADQGDEIIQHGCCHFYSTKDFFSHEEFCPRGKELDLNQQKKLLEMGWQALVKMGLRPKKIIQFPGWRADNQSIKAAINLHYQGILAKNLLYPQTVKTKFPSSYQLKLDSFHPSEIIKANKPINLIIHPSQKNEYKILQRTLKFLENQPVKFVRLSQALQVF